MKKLFDIKTEKFTKNIVLYGNALPIWQYIASNLGTINKGIIKKIIIKETMSANNLFFRVVNVIYFINILLSNFTNMFSIHI